MADRMKAPGARPPRANSIRKDAEKAKQARPRLAPGKVVVVQTTAAKVPRVKPAKPDRAGPALPKSATGKRAGSAGLNKPGAGPTTSRSSVRISFQWRKRAAGQVTAGLRAVAIAALERLNVASGEIGVLICDDATIRSLNRHFRHSDAATDVLSFASGDAQPDGDCYLGDIAISLETATRQAAERGVGITRELETLLLHGVLHLCGFDHEVDHGEMDAIETELRRDLLV